MTLERAGPLVILLIGVALAACNTSGSDCTLWNTETFFAKATVEDVARCRASGADASARSELFGKTPLHVAAASSESYAVIAVLVNSGADLEARDLTGRTPIHDAAEYNESPEVVKALLEAGADPKTRAGGGSTPLHAAVVGGVDGNPAAKGRVPVYAPHARLFGRRMADEQHGKMGPVADLGSTSTGTNCGAIVTRSNRSGSQ